MNINDIVSLFEGESKDKKLKDILQVFCDMNNIGNWDSFKNSARKIQFHSKKINKILPLCGDNYKPKLEYMWSCDEIEYVFKEKFTTNKLRKIDHIKAIFEGEILL